ncbi:FAD/NAD(P)-binding domain-containing protein [Phlegmacium glaucopus]|nr:FAD/NAD(P)-binding domain-containing protein [Phlegmacium glaucopus]
MSNSRTLKKIIIIGGGGAGAAIARTLSQQLDPKTHSITLMEEREYYLHYPAALRMLVSSEDQLEEKVLLPYRSLLVNGNGVIVHEKAAAITSKGAAGGGVVTTDSGKTYPYDVLVIASGSLWEGLLALPPTKVAAIEHVEKWRAYFKSSKGVAIVGGGSVGAELAGEIRDVYPDKKITIIQRDKHLLSATYPESFRVKADKTWSQRKIDLVLSDELVDFPAYLSASATVKTKNGVTVDADLIVATRGNRPNTAFLSSLGSDVLTPSGHVKVESSLQVKGLPGVFAAGDIIDWKEVKQVGKYGGHASTITSNIKNFLNGTPSTTSYKSMFEAIVLTNGKDGGLTYLDVWWGLQFGNFVTRLLKAKTLLVDMCAKNLGLQ